MGLIQDSKTITFQLYISFLLSPTNVVQCTLISSFEFLGICFSEVLTTFAMTIAVGVFIHEAGREVHRNVQEEANVLGSVCIYLNVMNYLQASDLWKLYQALLSVPLPLAAITQRGFLQSFSQKVLHSRRNMQWYKDSLFNCSC